ncbi:MAG: NADPH-dependent F420 reductase [Stellaceae bacterium]
MQIAIIGTGNVGSALGKRWAAADHDILFGVRDAAAQRAISAVAAAGARARAVSVGEAAQAARVVVLATPFSSTEAAIAACGTLAGKIVVDCTNPVAPDLSGLTIGHTESAGEAVARWAKGAKVVKALNTTGSGNMLNPRYGNEALSMFVCGDDADAKKLVTGLIVDLGFEPVDAGGLTQARYLEPLAMLWISMAYRYGNGPNFGFRVVRR